MMYELEERNAEITLEVDIGLPQSPKSCGSIGI